MMSESSISQFITPEQYADARLDILRDQLYIKVSPEDAAHLRSLKTETAIDCGIRAIINKYWE